MVQVTVKRPYKCSKEVCCSSCGLEYTKPHYKILFDRKKLVYFDIKQKNNIKPKTICHTCFFKYINKISKSKKNPYQIQFINGKKKSLMEISPFKQVKDDPFGEL